MRNCLSVDVEEWFHICGGGDALAPENWPHLPSRVAENTRQLLDLLDRCQVRSTFFVLGWVARHEPRLVEAIRQAGHEIASHGDSHRRVYEMSREAFATDLDAGIRALADAGAHGVAGYRAPEWSINDRSPWALEVLVRKGLQYDSSMTPLRIVGNPTYPQVPHIRRTAAGPIVEFPPLVGRWFGQNVPLGGGWGLRMSRPASVLREIADRNQHGQPALLFVHPWEIDPDPPNVRLPTSLRFSHYWRLDGYAGRLETILQGSRFGPIGDAYHTVAGSVRPS
jgi:polysaccharide deacetylase family protein (PEP-CTERM system associated)